MKALIGDDLLVVTSMNRDGWDQYGEKFVLSFLKHWPAGVRLRIYAEGFSSELNDPRIEVINFEAAVGQNVLDLEQQKTRLFKKTGIEKMSGYRSDVVKFSKKAFVLAREIRNSDQKYLIWLDADVVTLRSLTLKNISEICGCEDEIIFCSYLRRYGMHTESGFLAFNLKHPLRMDFCDRYESIYRSGAVFHLEGWTDCHVLDAVRTYLISFGYEDCFREIPSLTSNHPFVNSSLSLFMDHLKGDRKQGSSSYQSDFLIPPRMLVKFDGRYSQLAEILRVVRPKNVVEIGVWSGWRAVEMALISDSLDLNIHYRGYDVFENVPSDAFDQNEKNVKPHFSIKSVVALLELAKSVVPGFSYELVPGDTNQTLTSEMVDLVFLDGGHAVSTIRHDYEATSKSKVIVLDDYYVGIDTDDFGCNRIVDGLDHLILPSSDQVFGGGRVHFAVLGPIEILGVLQDRFPGARLVSNSQFAEEQSYERA